jgi:UDP:flavonoid glycosyltransferase YjiC (YdhE family)
MARVLFAWEFGAHFGHLRRDMPVARLLRDTGHEVLFAVRDVGSAAKVLSPEALGFVQAPILRTRVNLRRPPANYSELLLGEGYAQPAALAGGIAAWLQLFELYRPDVLVIDHGPTPSIAAHVARIPVVHLGCGFSIPPITTPMRRFNDKDRSVSEEALHASERTLIQNINAALRRVNRPTRLRDLTDLFVEESSLFAAFAELDHYGERAGAHYIGPIVTSGGTQECDWATNANTKVFAYLHNGVDGTSVMMDELSKADAEVICVVTDASTPARQKFSNSRMRVYGEPVGLQQVLSQANLVISNGGGALMSQALIAGVPVLTLPAHTEQFMQSNCVQRLGAGRVIGAKRDQATIRNAFNEMTETQQYRTKARAFAEKYASFDSKRSVDTAMEMIIRTARVGDRLH